MSSPNSTGASQMDSVNATSKSRLKSVLDLTYIRTFFFVMKVIMIIFSICGSISVNVEFSNKGEAKYYSFVTVTAIVIEFLLILLNLFRIVEKLDQIPWNFGEMIFDTLWAVLVIIAASIVTYFAKNYSNTDSYAAAAFFGFVLFIIFVIDAIVRLISLLRGGQRSKRNLNQASANSQPTY